MKPVAKRLWNLTKYKILEIQAKVLQTADPRLIAGHHEITLTQGQWKNLKDSALSLP